MNCLFCSLIRKEIPSTVIYESSKVFAFLDIGPLSKGHCLVIPKSHGAYLEDCKEDELAEMLPIAKKIIISLKKVLGNPELQYNILQNNGEMAHQEVKHCHMHIIPKPSAEEGLVIGEWKSSGKPEDAEDFAASIRKSL